MKTPPPNPRRAPTTPVAMLMMNACSVKMGRAIEICYKSTRNYNLIVVNSTNSAFKNMRARLRLDELALNLCHLLPRRNKLAHRLGCLDINRITFKTFRHFKGTMEYHKTKDILHVKNVLGHKNIKNTLV